MSNSLDGHIMARRSGAVRKGDRKEEEAMATEEKQ
jgi:hypothetical protein